MTTVRGTLDRILAAPSNISPQSMATLHYYYFKQFYFKQFEVRYYLHQWLYSHSHSVGLEVGQGQGNSQQRQWIDAFDALAAAADVWYVLGVCALLHVYMSGGVSE